MRSTTRLSLSLNGFWHFKTGGNSFEELREGDLIYVPSAWNNQNPMWFDFEGISWYQRTVYVPNLPGKVLLTSGGIVGKCEVWVNGEKEGSFDLSYIPFLIHLKNVKKGDENWISLKVDNTLSLLDFPPGNSHRQTAFDFYHYGGLIRDVGIVIVPEEGLEKVNFNTDSRGHLKLKFDTNCDGCEAKLNIPALGFSKSVSTEDEVLIPGVKQWSIDGPRLYEVKLELTKGEEVKDNVIHKLGFRDLIVEGEDILLNGRKIFLKGFGRHEDFPVTGKYVPGSVLIREFNLMKAVHANSFRTSHYPYSTENLELADEMGFLVILEAPLSYSTLNHITKDFSMFSSDDYLSRAKRVIEHIVDYYGNYTSVVMFSVANEPPSDRENVTDFLKELILTVKQRDSRPVTFASNHWSADKAIQYCDVISLNFYFGWYSEHNQIDVGVKKAEEELDKVKRFEKPILITEFGADAIAGFHSEPPVEWSEEYQSELLSKYIDALSRKGVAGIHIWNLVEFRTYSSPSRTGFNRKGILTREREPKSSYFAVKSIFGSLKDFNE
ncbi:beta-glucuronidase [Sulfolobales archaeon HS-7]|nr:beta-glucuronidase [Sulfolobales archaeon HS-7]